MNIIASYLSSMNNRLRSTSLVFILIIIELYFLINGSAHFENWSSSNAQIITIYILMVVSFMMFRGKETETEMNIPFPMAVVNFTVFFIGTYLVMATISALSGSSVTPIARDLFWPTVVMQVAVVATSEELMFRGVLLERFGILVSAILFAVWHMAAYSVTFYNLEAINIGIIVPFLIAFLMGIILAFIVKRKEFGLPSVIAVHSCFNLYVIGCFVTFGGI